MILRRLTTLFLLSPVLSSSVIRDVTRELASELTVASVSSDAGSQQAVRKQSSGNETQPDARHSRDNQSSLSPVEAKVTDAREAMPRGVVDGVWKSSVFPGVWRSLHFRGNEYACEEIVEGQPWNGSRTRSGGRAEPKYFEWKNGTYFGFQTTTNIHLTSKHPLFVCKCISGHGCPVGAAGIAPCRLSRTAKEGQDFPIMDCKGAERLVPDPDNSIDEQLHKNIKRDEYLWSKLVKNIRAHDLELTNWFKEFEVLVPPNILKNPQSTAETKNEESLESLECDCSIDKKRKHWPLADHFFYVNVYEDCYCEPRTKTTKRRLERELRVKCMDAQHGPEKQGYSPGKFKHREKLCTAEASHVDASKQYNMRLWVMFHECYWGRKYFIISIVYKLFPFFVWTAFFSLAPFAYLCGEGETSWIRVWIRRILISILVLKVLQFLVDLGAYNGLTDGWSVVGTFGDYGVEILIVIVPLFLFAAWTIYFLFLSDAFDETEAEHERRALQAKEAAKRKKAKKAKLKDETIASEDEPWYASYFGGGEGQSVVAHAFSSVKKTLYSFVRFYTLIGLAALTIWPLTYYWLKDIGLSGNLCDLGWVVIIVVERLLFAIETLSAYVISYIPLEFLPGAETARKFERNLYNTLYFQSVWAVMFYGNIANEVNKWFSGKINGKDLCPDQEMKYAARLTILYGFSVAFLHIVIAALSFTFIQDRWHDVRVDIEALVTGLADSAKGAVGLSHDPDVDWTPPSDDDDYRK